MSLTESMETLVAEAQNDRHKLNQLIEDFLPFIKKCVALCRVTPQSRSDALTVAMLAFANSVAAYQTDKGAFLPFAQKVIRNRLIDDFHAERRRTAQNVPLLAEEAESGEDWVGLSVRAYAHQLEQASLRLEIETLTEVLSAWNTSFAELVSRGPKQRRTRAQCQYVAALIMKNEAWRKQALEKRRLPSKDMCDAYGVSAKVVEKYRKYIAALCVIQAGDYPRLQAFLPMNRKEGVADE